MTGIINGLEDRILSLSGVDRANDGSHSFIFNGVDFITDVTPTSLKLHMSEACLAKLTSALKAEARVTELDDKNFTVSFQFHDDVDKEFVFLYIRYAWKHARAKSDAA